MRQRVMRLHRYRSMAKVSPIFSFAVRPDNMLPAIRGWTSKQSVLVDCETLESNRPCETRPLHCTLLPQLTCTFLRVGNYEMAMIQQDRLGTNVKEKFRSCFAPRACVLFVDTLLLIQDKQTA